MSRGQPAAIADNPIEIEETDRGPLQRLLEEIEEAARPRMHGVVIGKVVGVKGTAVPLVDFGGNPAGCTLPARSTVAITEDQIGRSVALMFENGSPGSPIVIGFMETIGVSQPAEPHRTTALKVDGERVVLTAEKELVLRCGDASITLTRTGKILIRGSSLVSRASGVNRIKGGSVQIN